MALVGIGELARLLKRDPKTIRQAVQRGRVTRRPDGLFDRTRLSRSGRLARSTRSATTIAVKPASGREDKPQF